MGNLLGLNKTYIYPYGESFHTKYLQKIYLDRVQAVLPEASTKNVLVGNCLGCITCLMQEYPPYLVFMTLWIAYIRDGDTIIKSAKRILYSMIFSSIYHKKYEYWLLAFAITRSLKLRWPYMQICKMPNINFWTVILSFDSKSYKYANFMMNRSDVVEMEKVQELIASLKHKSLASELAKIPQPVAKPIYIPKPRTLLRDPSTYM